MGYTGRPLITPPLEPCFVSYFIRLLSPKLTIAAGYIAKIPVLDDLLCRYLAKYARTCLELKRDRLSKRPIYLEYEPLTDIGRPTTLGEQAQHWFLNDIEDEWRQLCTEKEIDRYILDAFNLNETDRENLNAQVGQHALDINSNKTLFVNDLDGMINELLSVNCMLNRTRPCKTIDVMALSTYLIKLVFQYRRFTNNIN